MTRVAGGVCLAGLLGLALGSLGLAPAVAATATEERDAFFKETTILQLKIEIDKKEIESLRREPRKYVKSTLKVGDQEYKNVGVHVKGAAGSWQGIDAKPGLTLNMDKFADDQLYRGLDKFHLANSVQDPSYI